MGLQDGLPRGSLLIPVALALLLVIGVATALTVTPFSDQLKEEAPYASFGFSADTANGTVTIVHAGGDTLSRQIGEARTNAVVVNVTNDAQTTEVAWVAASGSRYEAAPRDFPIAKGDAFVIGDGTTTTTASAIVPFDLEDRAVVRVMWYGDERGPTTLGKYEI